VGLKPSLGAESLPPTRAITKGPNFHWFGYYDKLQFDPTSRFVLGMQVGFEHRSPKPEDLIQIGMIDLQEKDQWIPLGRSSAWNWQQGCMLQWRPGSATQIVYNDREEGRYISKIVDVKSKKEQIIPHPIYALSPDGKTGIAPDFRRLGDTRPGYGYNGIPDPFAEQNTPQESGIFKIDLETGKSTLLIPVADILSVGTPKANMKDTKHWFNHLLFNTNGTRFVFLHRWRVGKSWNTRMITSDLEGKNLRVVDDNGMTSHFIWRDADHLLAWSNRPEHGRRFYLFEDGGKGKIEVVGKDAMLEDGHCTYLPGNEWILCDTYPDQARLQHPYLFQIKTGKKFPLGNFLSPKEYTGEWRCDAHPRFSPNGKFATIDSPHHGGRQIYLIELEGITKQG
jgi:hypothetical protein